MQLSQASCLFEILNSQGAFLKLKNSEVVSNICKVLNICLAPIQLIFIFKLLEHWDFEFRHINLSLGDQMIFLSITTDYLDALGILVVLLSLFQPKHAIVVGGLYLFFLLASTLAGCPSTLFDVVVIS